MHTVGQSQVRELADFMGEEGAGSAVGLGGVCGRGISRPEMDKSDGLQSGRLT